MIAFAAPLFCPEEGARRVEKMEDKALVYETINYPDSYTEAIAEADHHTSDDGEGRAAILSGPGRN
jgi:hypothetical protein